MQNVAVVCNSVFFFFRWLGLLVVRNAALESKAAFLPPLGAAAAKSLQSCPTVCDPVDGSPPGSPSLGFSRQEHWSGLPFPSLTHESEKLK